MTKKIEHLSSELQDFFPEEKNMKLQENLSHLADMKEDFSLSPSFKSSLKTRLQDIYKLDHTRNFTRTSFFPFVGILTSFLFVSGFGYFYYTTQQAAVTGITPMCVDESLMDTQTSFSETDQASWADTIANKEIQDSWNIKVQPKSLPVTDSWNIPASASQTPLLKPSTFPENGTVKEEVPPSAKISSPSPDDSTSSISPAIDQDLEDQDEYIIPKIFDTYMPQEEMMDFDPSLETIPSSDMMETFRMGVPQDSFMELCLSYSGSLSDDMQLCLFGSGRFCTAENMLFESEEACEFLPQENENSQVEEK